MAYANFTLNRVTQTFGLIVDQETRLFANVEPVTPSANLREWLDEFSVMALGTGSEQARSIFLIGPILAEVRRRAGVPMTIWASATFDIEPATGLTGVCDFLVTRAIDYYTIRAPIAAVAEAKKEDMIGGIGQCAAEMVAVQKYNEQEGSTLPAVYGATTSGNTWRFLRLAGNRLWVDRDEYYLTGVDRILGVLVSVARGTEYGLQ